MYDTIRFNIKSKDASCANLADAVSPYVNFTQSVSEYGSTSSTFRLDNLYGRVSATTLSVNSGSICKYLHGNNLVNFTRWDMKLAVEKLSDTLHLAMDKATVTKIDFAYNFSVSLPPESYFFYLGELPYYSRGEMTRDNGLEGLYYCDKSNKMKLAFYDKVKEFQKNGETIPLGYEGRNLLRYEMRLIRHWHNRLEVDSKVNLSTLYDEAFYRKLVGYYKNTYFRIEKTVELIPNFMEFAGFSGLKNVALLKYIDSCGGIVPFYRMIDNIYTRGDLDKRTHREIKRQVQKLYATEVKPVLPNTAIEELDGMMKLL